jgi:glutaconate CoA-transferase subunit B
MAVITDTERASAAAALQLRDGEACFVGIGMPSIAALLAKHTHAPRLALVYESGAYGTEPAELPMSTGSPSVARGAACIGDCSLVFGDLQAGRIDVGLLSAAQVDRRGSLNSTVIGDYRHPKVRLVGSGGAHDIASLAGRTVIVMPHDPRRFVERVDFVTAPGLDDEGRRPPGTRGAGPVALVTPRATFGFSTGEMTLESVHEGFTADEAVEGFGWDVPRADRVGEIGAPGEAEIEIMRRWTGGR